MVRAMLRTLRRWRQRLDDSPVGLAPSLILLSVLVIGLLYSRFEHEMQLIRMAGLGTHTADVNRLSTLLATGQLGISNMRRRPLRTFLHQRFGTEDGVLRGIGRNLAAGRLKACAVTTTNYATGQTVTWVEGRNIDDWERPDRVGVQTVLTVDHVLASTSLPLLFPAVRLDGAWYGDGGVRLAAPLAVGREASLAAVQAAGLDGGSTYRLFLMDPYGRNQVALDQAAIGSGSHSSEMDGPAPSLTRSLTRWKPMTGQGSSGIRRRTCIPVIMVGS